MLLTFSKKMNFDKSQETGFDKKIANLEKIHTFRASRRIKPGDLLHLWSGTPRAKKGASPIALYKMRQMSESVIFKDDDKGDKVPICQYVEACEIYPDMENFGLKIGGVDYSQEHLLAYVASRDGFDSVDDFKRWFCYQYKDEPLKWHKLYLYHWTNQRYTVA